MSLDYIAIEGTVKTVVAQAMGVNDTDVRWQTEQSSWREGLVVNLRRSPLMGVGRDERRRTVQGSGESKTWPAVQVGQRVMRVTVRVESDRSTPLTGMDHLGNLRTAIYRPALLAELRAAGLALRGVSDVTEYEAPGSLGAALACAALELTFGVADVLADGNDAWFEAVSAQADFSSPDSSHEVTIP